MKLRLAGFVGLMAVAMPWAPVYAADGVIPFTTWQVEQQAIQNGLPCSWVSTNGKMRTASGNESYDFACKGGVWATITLFMDKADGIPDGVGRVQLLYRAWPEGHPAGGDAAAAQNFLKHIANRFIPLPIAGDVMEDFWGQGSRNWGGDGVTIRYTFENGKDFNLHRLVIEGEGRSLIGARGAVVREETATPLPSMRHPMNESGGLLTEKPTAPASNPNPVDPELIAPLPAPREDLNFGIVKEKLSKLLVPADAPASAPSPTLLPQATPAELNTLPEPESFKQAAPLPAVAPGLVPPADQKINERAKAPSNFDAYNRAVELTKDVEKKAHTAATQPAKVKATTAADRAQETLKLAPAKPAESLKPVPTPVIEQPAAKLMDTLGVPQPVQNVRPSMVDALEGISTPAAVRPLPQLRFVPKAEPLSSPDETIKFENEGSKL